jgi:hypothetical protein
VLLRLTLRAGPSPRPAQLLLLLLRRVLAESRRWRWGSDELPATLLLHMLHPLLTLVPAAMLALKALQRLASEAWLSWVHSPSS